MALTLKDRCKQKITANAGTGNITLSTSVRGFKTISSALSNGDTSYFCLESANGDWEVFSGTYTASGTTISRDTVLASSNSGNKIDIGTSITFCYIVYPADKSVYRDNSNRAVVGSAGLIFSDNTVQTTAATTPDLSPYAPLASPAFTGVPTAPTASDGTNTTQIATTAFVASAVGSIDLSPYLTISSAASIYLTQSSATTLLAAKADLVGGLVPSSQLPSYVDDVVEAANLAAFPGTGETGKIYVAIDTGYTYRWSGSVYVRINEVDLSSYLTAATAASTYVALAGSYANPDWITQLAWSKLTGVPSAVSSLSGVNTGDQDLSSYATTAAVAAAYVPLTRTLNGLALSSNQTFAVGTSGTDFAVVSTGTSHTFNLPDASATARGLVTTGTQTFAGTKTLVGDLLFTDATYDIGKSGATRPRDGWFSRDLVVGGQLKPKNGDQWSPSIQNSAFGTGTGINFTAAGTFFIDNNSPVIQVGIGGQSKLVLGCELRFASTIGAAEDLVLVRDAADTFAQRRTTNPQTYRLYETFSSSTSFGSFQIKANTGAAYQIGSAIGSAGGTNRDLAFGHWNSAGTFTSALSIATTGAATFAGDLLFTDATYDIGKSGATRPRDGFFSRNMTIGSLLTTSTINMPGNANVNTGGITAGTSYGLYFANNGTSLHYAHNGTSIFSFGSFAPHFSGTPTTAVGFGFGATSTAGDVFLQRDAAGILHQRNSTNAQTFRLAETYTSTTSFGAFQIQANTGAAYQIGSAVGSAGGTNRDLGFGHWNAAGTFTSRIYITAAGNVGISHGSVSYLRDVFQVNTTSTSTSFGSANIATQGITITNSTNTINRPVGLQFSGYEGWGFGGVYGTMTDNGGNTSGRISIALRPPSGGSYTEICRWSETTGAFSVFPWASTSGSPTIFTVTGPAHTTLAASTEASDAIFNFARTVQFSTGALTTQRAFRIQAPTYSFVGASTITTASTLSISGAPTAGTNATITNAYALNVESGKTQFGGWTQVGGTDSWNTPLSVGNRVQMWASGYDCLIMNFGAGSQLDYHASWGINGIQLQNRSAGFGWSSLSNNFTNFDAALYSPSANIIEQRSGTNAQTLRVYNTYTSTTSSESGELRWTSNVLYIGSNKGSAGGSARNVAITHGGNVVANFLADRFYLGPIADSTATGGNARGQYAIDLQLLKSSATQVASGLYSVAIGVTNVSSGENTIAIGLGNTSSNYDSVTIGKNNGAGFGGVSIGWGNTAGLSGVAIGQSNAANGDTAAAIGNRNTASGGSSFASGAYSLSDRLGQRSHASGRFAANGDAQSVLFVLRNKTTNNTPTTLFLDGSSTRLTIPSGKTMSCQVTVKGIKSDGSAKARFVRLVEITNVGGTTSLDTSVEAIGTDYNPSGCDCDITPDDTNDAIQINVTGITAETWRWVAIVEGLEIAYGT